MRPRAARRACQVLTLALLVLGACAETTGGVHARFGYSETGGLRVVEVPPGPAARAGLRENDRVVSIDGTAIRTLPMREVVERLRGPVGSRVRLEVSRGDELVELEIARVPYR